MQRLDRYDREEEVWEEILIPDKTCTPAELAASRIDFPEWLDTLTPRDRKVAFALPLERRPAHRPQVPPLAGPRVADSAAIVQAWRAFQGENLALRRLPCRRSGKEVSNPAGREATAICDRKGGCEQNLCGISPEQR